MDIEKLKSRSEQISVYLPEEIIEEILWRLPMKYVLRLRGVSKSWRCLIGSERFIERHLQFSAKNRARGRVISGMRKLKQCSLQSLLNEPITSPQSLGLCGWSQRSQAGVVGCCNGLVCIYSSSPGGRFFLWNPSTGISKDLPIGFPVSGPSVTGFGWDESSGAYKVCAFADVPGSRGHTCQVYSSKTNSWEALDSGRDLGFFLCSEGQFVSGKVHWLRTMMTSHNVDIVTLDLKSEAFGVMEQPCDRRSLGVSLGVLEGCLCVVSTDYYQYPERLDVWVMKQYGVKESWFKIIAAVPLVYEPDIENSFPASFGVAPNGDILFTYGSGFLVYNPKHKLLLPLKGIKGFFKPHLCLETASEKESYIYQLALALADDRCSGRDTAARSIHAAPP